MDASGSRKDFDFIPIPQTLRYDPKRPFPEFGIGRILLFAFACTFITANLYYCQTLLFQFSGEFGVLYSESSRAVTLVHAGYAVGLFFIAPLGDILRRRQLILGLIFCSATLMLCLALVPDWNAFLALSFLAGTINVATQILIPLAADVVHPARKFFFLSILISALVMGMLVARVLAGVITQYADWRVVYYLAVGVQVIVLVVCYATIPDYPAKNKGMGYWELIKSMVGFAVKEPLLIQACLVNFLASAGYSNFWTTLTFLLGGPPYNYSSLVIGLFGLVGIVGVCLTPLATLTVDKLHPWYGSVLGTILYACFQALLVAAAGLHFASILLAIIGIVVFCRVLQVSLQMSVFSISKAATTRLNALLLLSFFLGQVMGSSVGSRVFLEHGWRAGAGLSLGWTGLGFLLLIIRGPHCERKTWLGYEGGFGMRKGDEQMDQAADEKDSAENV
ncbi:major facilitator superfamily domain-containing protein [Armillaria luteobubalina]|uniref:Major facilitator superfamily domain-containing protein n=1 Tax=Armillaria luteobubalina TaxID=153913 RepID=A0AA39UUP2_9AGAR|nr:major facilitator superfamily domain-containing protein [Armillaria luteobubalina]